MKFLLRLLLPYRVWIALALVLGGGVAALGAVEPLFLQALTDLLVRASATRHSSTAASGTAMHAGMRLLALLAAVLLASRLLQTAANAAVNRVRFDLSFRLSTRVLHRIYEQPLSFHQSSGAGYVLTRMDRGVAALGQLAGDLLQSLLPNAINLAIMMALLVRISPRLAWVGLAPMPLFLWATVRGARVVVRHEEVVQEGWSRLYSRVSEVLGGIKTVKSMAGEVGEVEAYRRQTHGIFARLWTMVWVDEIYGHLKNALALTGRIAVAAYGFYLVLHGVISAGAWIAATAYAALLYGPLAGLAGTYSAAARNLVAARAVLDYLESPADADTDAEDELPAAAALAPLNGAIEFDQVSYAYPAADSSAAPRYAVDGMSFRITPGETIAVIGPSGGGKTTLMDLLLRFHDPVEGAIRLDGRDLATIAPADLRRQVAVVLQEPFLLEGSITENLVYGLEHPPAAGDTALWEALRAAQAADFVERLPQGLATRLGERGARLSGGEKQRLAIARALLRDPRILILDEATAHLDAASESALNHALRTLVRGRTALVISHRLASLIPCDRIFVIAQGRLVEQGPPAALAQGDGFYAQWAGGGVELAAVAAGWTAA